MAATKALLKLLATLVGLALTLGGVAGLLYGTYGVLAGQTGMGIVAAAGSVAALAIGTVLGKFARGDYD